MQYTETTPTPPTPSVSPGLSYLRPRICVYCREVCTEETGAYAVRSRTGGVGAACGPCFARHHPGAKHYHPVGRRCPVCANIPAAGQEAAS